MGNRSNNIGQSVLILLIPQSMNEVKVVAHCAVQRFTFCVCYRADMRYLKSIYGRYLKIF